MSDEVNTFTDETSVKTNMTPLHGRSLKGERLMVEIHLSDRWKLFKQTKPALFLCQLLFHTIALACRGSSLAEQDAIVYG